MKRDILINANPRETRVAILEDDQLVELLVDRPDARRMVGDIYLGKVESVLPGIQAAFVNIGTEKSAFLHASDLVQPEDEDDEPTTGGGEGEGEGDGEVEAESENEREGQGEGEQQEEGGEKEKQRQKRAPRKGSARGKSPAIQDLVKRGQDLLVQVTKEPISTKGPRVTAQISLAGRFLVYLPDATRVGVSRKIGDRAERQRLREMVRGALPEKSGGVIVRTVGEDATEETFKRELSTLISTWKKIQRKARFLRAPAVVHRETNLTRGITRDLFSDKVDALKIDSKQLYNEIVEYLQGIAPDLIPRVSLYEEPVALFDTANLELEIRDLFKRRCDLPSGGYLIIEPTEALVSIDVNSGRYTGRRDPEKTILRTNVEAAREIARQLRLRDVGGIIVCDFIDMETKANRDRVLQELRGVLARDRARTKTSSVSDLGLIEMTRQRVRQSHLQSMTAACPTCHGTGRVFTPETIMRRVERSLQRIGVEGRRETLLVKLHPDVAMYMLEEEQDFVRRVEKGSNLSLELRDDPLLGPDEFKIVVKGAGRDLTAQYAVA